MPLRFDVGTLEGVEKTPQGGFRVAAHLTRTGIFHYDDGKGGMVAEYRPPDEVSHADSLATLLDAPFTVGHPGLVTPDNHSQHATGHVRDPRMDGERVAATVVVQGRKAIRAIEKGTRQISCGYTCTLDEVPGLAPNGERYDRVQRGIRYNHVALVDRGRAGDDVRLRLDSAGNQSNGDTEMEFERIDGVKYEVGSEAHAAAAKVRDKAEAERAQRFDALTADVTKFKTLSEAVAADKAKLTDQVALLSDPKRLDEAVAARAMLIDRARGILGKNADGTERKFDGKSDTEIKLEVVAAAYPSMKFDAKEPIRVDTAFDLAVSDLEKTAARIREDAVKTAKLRGSIIAVDKNGAGGEDIMAQAAREREERNRDAWKVKESA